MPSPKDGNGTHSTRATTNTTLTQTKPEDIAKKLSESTVKDPISAINFLTDKDLKCEDDELTLELLSMIVMQLLQQPRSTKLALEAFKAMSYLILDLHQKNIEASITDNIARAINMAMKRVRDELAEATDQLVLVATKSAEAGDQLISNCQETVEKYKGAMEGATLALTKGAIQTNTGLIGGDKVGEEGEVETYADKVKRKVPPTHATAVARADTQKRRIRPIKAMGMVGDGTNDLTEKQLVEKANLAMGMMMEGEDSRPEGSKFIGANKERGLGGVSYELNTEEVAAWLKVKATMLDFLSNMGSTTDFREQMYKVVMDWIPVMLEVDQPIYWRAIEKASGVRDGVIKEAAWIKPIHLCVAGQRTAIAIFKLAVTILLPLVLNTTFSFPHIT